MGKKEMIVLLLVLRAVLSFGQAVVAPGAAVAAPGAAVAVVAPGVHDPVMIKEGSVWYIFCTGRGISVFTSTDREHWTAGPPVFLQPPAWAVEAVPGFKGHIWAPDISYHNGRYYLYYAVSAFGKNTSCIGLAVNKTLDSRSPDFKWEDVGKVVQSVPGRDNWNAIDPNLGMDSLGRGWLAFGSFWGGIKLVRLSEDLRRVAEPEEWRTIAGRARGAAASGGGGAASAVGATADGGVGAASAGRGAAWDARTADTSAGDGAIEAPFIFKRGGWYYLFVSWDYCCRAEKSTYKMVVGRSLTIDGPYLDKEGKAMTAGGGSLVLEGDADWYGVGHNAVIHDEDGDWLVFHGYDAHDKGRSKLRIRKLSWLNDWPTL